jgi:hypothetical protein
MDGKYRNSFIGNLRKKSIQKGNQKRKRETNFLKTLQTETSYVVRGKEINRDIESSGERNQ